MEVRAGLLLYPPSLLTSFYTGISRPRQQPKSSLEETWETIVGMEQSVFMSKLPDIDMQ